MLSKNKIKFINALKKKKSRNEKGCFIAEGSKTVADLLASGMQARLICSTGGWMQSHSAFSQANIIEHIEITGKDMQKISSLKTPQEVLGVFVIPEYREKEEKLIRQISLVLDRIHDPGNLGTIIRIADWFGIQNVICSADTVDAFNPKTVQATMGSLASVNIFYRDLPELMKKFSGRSGFNIYGCFLEGENLYTAPLGNRGFIIMGSESHGISSYLMPFINRHLAIPSFSEGYATGAESLNVSVATGIVCSEFRRRKATADHHSK